MAGGSHLRPGKAVALLTGAIALWGLLALGEDVITHDPQLQRWDQFVAMWFHAHTFAALTSVVLVMTAVGGPPFVLTLTLILAGGLALRGRRPMALLLLACVPGGQFLNFVAKQIVHRPRPLLHDPLAVLTTYSFPSGHALGATVLYGALALAATRFFAGGAARVLSALAAVSMIVLISLSRLYLGVHYLSDVIAGVLEGVVWLIVCFGVADHTHAGKQGAFGRRI